MSTATKTVSRLTSCVDLEKSIKESKGQLRIVGKNDANSEWSFVMDGRKMSDRFKSPVKICGKKVRAYMGNTYLMNAAGLKRHNLV